LRVYEQDKLQKKLDPRFRQEKIEKTDLDTKETSKQEMVEMDKITETQEATIKKYQKT